MRLNLKDEPLLDETMELPSLSVAPGPPHPRGGRGSFSSSYSSGFAGTDSLVSFNSSQLFDDSDDHEVDVDAMDSNSSRGDYALLSMPVESVKHMVPTTSVVTRSSNRTLNATWNSQDCSFGRATAITDALRELREGRVAVEDEETEPVSVTLRQLVTRLSTRRDLFVMAMGLLAASIHGVLWALLARQVQSSIAAFTPYDRHDVDFAALTLMLLSLALGVTAYAAHLCLSHSSERLLRALREQLLRHLLLDRSQLWFDSNKSVVADFGAELTRDSLIIRQGLGPELGAVLAFMALWDLTLAISCVTPIIVRVITIVRQTRAKTDNEADAVATEALSNMQTVLALNAQRRVREKHALRVRITEKERVLVRGRHAALRATLTGTLWVSSAIGLWYGGKKVYEAEAEPGQVFGTFLGVIIGSHALGHLIPSFAALTRAKHASSELFTVLETPLKPHNNVMNPLPRPASCSGAIMAVDLHFSYPRRPDLQVLRGCNISLLSGECVAIVGDGGAGKSTLLMLLMRLYEPSQGLILLDGREVNALDSTWMRAQYGLVPQHVTLFRASIFDNIAVGLVVLRDLTGRNSDRMEERVINAAQQNGVVKLTAQQRQRIALARALIREPKLLLLDEVLLSPQELLSRFGGAVGAGSTTMLLCTSQVRAAAVQYADNIGTHVELLQRGNSFYRRLHLIQHSALTKRDIKALSRPERQFLAFGLAASVIVGLGGPLLGVLISEMAADMVQQYSTYLESYDAVRLVQTLRPLVMRPESFWLQLFCLDAAAERVASHLRDLHFSSLLAQPLAFFDQYNTKELVESLATQASTASLAVGRAQGYKLQIFCTLTTTFVLAFWSGSWMLTLVLLAALPLLLIGYSIHNQQRLRAPTTLGATEEAVEIHVNEALRNRRAVVILGLENSWCSSFDVLLQRPLQSIRRGVLEHYGDATFQELMRSLVVVIVSAESLGLAVAWLTRIDRALQAGANIFAIRDAAIVASGANEASTSDGERDPMPQSPMLRGSLPGQTVALCGPRGAGMSTIFSLIEGFYDLLSASGNSGRVMLDGADMRALEVSWLRAQVSFVGSEPTLFLGTIAENIAYGMAAPPTLEMIVSASEVAHAHAFISRLPEGYATRVGGQLQLSPSQRQRIALARTVLKTLDFYFWMNLHDLWELKARRLLSSKHSTLSSLSANADLIYVIQDGRVVNQGTHSELFQIQDGVYARLLQASTWSVASSNSYTVSLNTT
ncbi:P-loop containing nucleoside triphosphate hydrolase [Phytophthora cactorum]|nr:P-loop containing nucleoside triphosphate hydrolase [Phytophthora cactorum]